MNESVKKTLRGWRPAPRGWRRPLLCIAAVTALSLSMVERGFAENPWAKSRNAWGSAPNAWGNSKTPWANSQNNWGRSPSPKAGKGVPSNFSGYMTVPSEGIAALPSMEPRGGKYIDGGAIPDGLETAQRPPKRATRHRQSGAHAAKARRHSTPLPSPKPESLKEPK